MPHRLDPLFIKPDIAGEFLQLALAVLGTALTVIIVIKHQQFKVNPAGLIDFLVGCGYNHALLNGGHTRYRRSASFNFNQADPANPDRSKIGMIAEVRNVDSVGQGSS